jgi:hypothetical protein
MKIFYLLLGIGQIVNLYKVILLATENKAEKHGNDERTGNILLDLIKEQSYRTKQTEFSFRFLGLFLFYGAIWGLIDIFRMISGR